MYRLVLAIIFLLAGVAVSSPLPRDKPEMNFDQRQSGKYNIHLNIKDVAIISLGSDDISGGIGDAGSFYEDYYDYDLEDFTISSAEATLGVTTKKPKPSTTESPKPEEQPAKNQTISDEPASSTAKPPALTIVTDKPDKKPSSTTNANKTQSVVILADEVDPGKDKIVVTVPTPAADEIPPQVNLSHVQTAANKPVAMSENATSIPSKPVRSDPSEIPVQVIMEPVLRPKTRIANTNRSATRQNNRHNKTSYGAVDPATDSIMKQTKARRNTHGSEGRRLCGRNQVIDRQGRCHNKRSGV